MKRPSWNIGITMILLQVPSKKQQTESHILHLTSKAGNFTCTMRTSLLIVFLLPCLHFLFLLLLHTDILFPALLPSFLISAFILFLSRFPSKNYHISNIQSFNIEMPPPSPKGSQCIIYTQTETSVTYMHISLTHRKMCISRLQ